jgi:23S rRNA pseudouridine1911/1915/1917 synthase
MRIDLHLAEKYPEISRARMQKLIADGFVFIDGKPIYKKNYEVDNQEVVVNFPENKNLESVLPENILIDIIYEDEYLLAVNKPRGMVVHPAAGNYSGTLVNALLFHCGSSLSGINGVNRPGIVHRIDKDTTGLLLVAKNDKAHKSLAKQIKNHSLARGYLALVHGRIESDGAIDKPIARSLKDRKKMAISAKGREAITHYKVVKSFEKFTLIECRLQTGRTHQIRVHMKSINRPVVGDRTYGLEEKGKLAKLQGQLLHAYLLGFIHPSTGEYMEFTADLPKDFSDILESLA